MALFCNGIYVVIEKISLGNLMVDTRYRVEIAIVVRGIHLKKIAFVLEAMLERVTRA